jgi:aspartyl/glutamyl-tRNA(Asn/Gln) amidotransferase C subunit
LITQDEIRKLAKMSHLAFSDGDFVDLESQFAKILKFLDSLDQIDEANTSDQNQDIPIVLRKDAVSESSRTEGDANRLHPRGKASYQVTRILG